VVTSTLRQLAGSDRLLTIDDIAHMLGRSPSTIRKDIVRRPGAVPPRVRLPGTRQLRWRSVDVQDWLARHTEGVQS
jgi:predicted DNA-binding transcriptional regulator AlpA